MTDFNWNLWLDKHNILHIHENPEPEQSENGLTFTGSLHVLWKACNMKSELPKVDLSKFMTKGDDGKPLFLPTPESALNSHFSLDNMFGVYALRELYSPELELPTMKWYKPKGLNENISQYWFRPDTIAFNALLNKLPFAKLIAPTILKFGANLTCKKPKDHTSGKRILFDRYLLLSLSNDESLVKIGKEGLELMDKLLTPMHKIGKEGLELMDKLLTPMHGKNPMIDITDFYFKNPNHPCRKLIRMYYEKTDL